MEPRILITGASGFVGRAMVARAASQGIATRGVSRSPLEPVTGVDLCHIGEIGSQTDWSLALRDIDVVVHLAARVHVMSDRSENPLAEFRSVNVDGTLNLAQQAVAAGVKRLVFLSSVKVNGEVTLPGRAFTEAMPPDPQDAYAISKYEAEKVLVALGRRGEIEVVIVRPPLVYGPNVKANFAALFESVQRSRYLPLGALDNRRSLVGLDNLIDLVLTCVTHPRAANETFLVSDGQDLSTSELVRSMARAAGVPARLVPVPIWALHAVAAFLGKTDAVKRLCGNQQVDISKARDLLDWRPRLSVDEGMRRVVLGHQQHEEKF